MGSTVAMKGHRGHWIAGFSCGYRIAGLGFGYGLWIHAANVFTISVGTQGDQKDKWNDAPQQAWFVTAITGHAQAVESFGRAGGKQNILCLFLPVLADSDLKRQMLTEPGVLTVPGKGGDVGKYLRPALRGRDKSKAAIIIPFCESAFDAYISGLTLGLS